MAISAVNFRWLTDPHDLQGILANRRARLPLLRGPIFYKMVRLFASGEMLYPHPRRLTLEEGTNPRESRETGHLFFGVLLRVRRLAGLDCLICDFQDCFLIADHSIGISDSGRILSF